MYLWRFRSCHYMQPSSCHALGRAFLCDGSAQGAIALLQRSPSIAFSTLPTIGQDMQSRPKNLDRRWINDARKRLHPTC
jgi:hypothetical protein